MHVFGVVGGIGSGKSLAAACFSSAGAELLDADRMARAVLDQSDVQRALLHRWGTKIADADGRIERRRLSELVFGDDARSHAALDYLERLVHPVVWRQTLQAIRAALTADRLAVVLDAPLLLEAGWDLLCDTVVFVDAPLPVRVQRVAARGWSAADLAARERRQMPLENKRWRSDVCLDNRTDDRATLEQQVAACWSSSLGTSEPLLDIHG
jgi:dephospho-CoA kinase